MGCKVGSGACQWQLSPTFLPSAPSANPPHPMASPGWVRRASNPKETPRGDDQISEERRISMSDGPLGRVRQFPKLPRTWRME